MSNTRTHPFRDALAKGLGRAVVHVRRYSQRYVRAHLLYACLHDLSYDPQLEDSRAEWLMGLVDRTHDGEFYRKRILTALVKSRNNRHLDHLFTFAGLFAQRGDKQAREAIYEKFRRLKSHFCYQRCLAVIDGDGLTGLVRIAEILGARLRRGKTDCYISDACHAAESRFGRRRVLSTLRKEAAASANVRAWLDVVLPELSDSPKFRRPPRSLPTMQQVIDTLDAGVNEDLCRRYLYVLRKHGNTRQIAEFYRYMLSEKRPKRVMQYLRVFWYDQSLPWFDPRLLEWAESDDIPLRCHAIGALANLEDPAVRRFALRLLGKKRSSLRWDALLLLKGNYVSGDHAWLESMLPSRGRAERMHIIGMNLISIAEAQPDPDLAGCMLWAYEHTPCSHCRGDVVRFLIRRRRAHLDLLRECLEDCNGETRTIARSALRRRAKRPSACSSPG